MEHPIRQRIVDLVRQHPMASKGYIREQLGVAWGMVQHHIQVLERAEILAVVRVGKKQRFFVTENKPHNATGVALLRTPRMRQLAEFIAGNPGVGQTQITQAVAMHRKVLRSYMDRLVEAGLVEELQEGRARTYYSRSNLDPALELLDGHQPASPEENLPTTFGRRL